MTSGGARLQSGPRPDPLSQRSDKRGYQLSVIPAKPYTGTVPAFPLPEANSRELDLWEDTWRLPQAHLWSQPAQAWRQDAVAMWVRVRVRCESPRAGAMLLAQLHRFADQIGMTDAGLAGLGYRIETEAVPVTAPRRKSSRDRLKVVPYVEPHQPREGEADE